MVNCLRFTLKRLLHPYSGETSSGEESWGSLSIDLLRSNEESVMLLSTQWNISSLINWFHENEEFIQEEQAIIDGNFRISNSESLAKYVNRLLEREFSEDEEFKEDKWYEDIYQFRQHHALRSALRGANIPDIFIGLNRDQGEVSLCSDDESWFYQFDMNNFIDHFATEIKSFQASMCR